MRINKSMITNMGNIDAERCRYVAPFVLKIVPQEGNRPFYSCLLSDLAFAWQ